MTPSDRQEFLRVMNGLASVFGANLTPEALDVWWGAFGDWTLQDFKLAAGAAVTRCKFMPRPADLFDVRRAETLTAGEAWDIAGRGRDRRADRALRIATQGRYVGHIPLDELPWIQKRFIEVYDQLVDVDSSREVAGELQAPEQRSVPRLRHALDS